MERSIIELAKTLIAKPSITPEDAGCQEIIMARLRALHFCCETLNFGKVNNFYARFGKEEPLLIFAGHTDVVPPGAPHAWDSPPFNPSVKDDFLYGRGATDMKGALAAMVVAVEQFIQTHGQDFKGSIGFVITSDEEGLAEDGTTKVVDWLLERGEKVTYCIIGEPTSETDIADQIRVGRRGSLHGKLLVKGKQGHIAYPTLAHNPIHAAMSALQTLVATTWDEGNDAFPPTSFQISNIHSGTGATNIIPQDLEVVFNFRFSPASTVESLKKRVESTLREHRLTYQLTWRLSAEPFASPQGKLLEATMAAINSVMHIHPKVSTAGGVSDGRFFAKTGAEIVELGTLNKTAHQVNECVAVNELENLGACYLAILHHLFRKS